MEYDYVIAGGGSAGCVLAARLSEDPDVSVCLLEAGGRGDGLLIRAPALVVAMISGRPKINNWALETVPQPGLNNRRGFQPRGRTLGGSSAINAMLYVRGHPSDYDDWANMGCDGWDWASVLPHFKRLERNERGADALHGADGDLHVADQAEPRAISEAFVEACGSVQIRRNDDFNGAEQEGAGLYQVTQFHDRKRRGERCSAAAAYVHPVMRRRNLTVVTGALAGRILMEGTRATGIQYDHKGVRKRVTARREVILCGGAFGSPQLLMLSGIGPRDELAAQGIEVVHDLPGVGQNLQDHLDHVLSYHSLRDDVLSLMPKGLVQIARAGLDWRRRGKGLFASPCAEGGAFFKSSPEVARPDLQMHFVIGIVDDHMRKLHFKPGYSCHVCVLRPHSRGTVGLQGKRARTPPRIDPGYLSDPRDLDLLKTGVRRMESVLESEPLSPWRGKRLYPHDGSDAALEADIRNRADTIYHPVGTCKMGVDDMAVVDPAGCVHGITGLRVADASVMPTLIGGNTNAPTMMIADKIADAVLAV